MQNFNKTWPQIGDDSWNLLSIGRKADYLTKLIKNEFPVPPGYVVLADHFMEVVKYNRKNTILSNLLKKQRAITWVEISTLIDQLIFPQQLIDELKLISEKIGWPLAVRSSSIDEDGDMTSKAGIYKSIIDCSDMDDLIGAIKQCWASSFSPLAQQFGSGNKAIPLIIQKSLVTDQSGVAFSIDPVLGDSSVVVVCGVVNGGSDIVSGRATGSVSVFSKQSMELQSGKSKGEIDLKVAKEVAEITLLIEKKLNLSSVDIEWVYSEGRLRVLQARPVTFNMRNEHEKLPVLYDLESTECLNIPLDKLYVLHNNWFERKFPFRKKAKDLGIRIPKGGYMRYSPKTLTQEEVAEVLKDYNTFFLILDRSENERSIIIRNDEAYSFLRAQQPSNNGLITIRVRELPCFDMSGHSACLEDGKILIESIPGTFNSIFKMHLVPGNYIIDEDDNIISSKVQLYNKCSRIDTKTLQFVESFEHGLSSELPKNLIKQISWITRIMGKYVNEARLEWTMENGDLFLFDFSVEKQSLSIFENSENILSKGNFQGMVFILNDTSILESICTVHTVSVLPDSNFYETQNSRVVQDLISELKQVSEKPIVVARQPLSELALIANSVTAFIFEEGSVLCHLGIILREMGVPAVFMNEALTKLKDKSQIVCINGNIKIL